MSKFYISKSGTFVKKVIDYHPELKVTGQHTSNGFSSVCFDKMSLHHDNCFVEPETEGFVYLVGTPIKRAGLDVPNILQYILSEVNKNIRNIDQVKKDILGMWAALVYTGGKAYVFNDYYGLYDICYSNCDDSFSIGNDLADVARFIHTFEYDEYSFIMECFQSGAFPGGTIFKDVKKLKSSQYILIEQSKMEVYDFEKTSISYTFVDEDTALHDIKSLVQTYADIIDKMYSPEIIGMTGGLDSRLLFAAFNSVGARFSCFHGISSITYTGDRDIVESICKYYNKSLEYHDWQQPMEFCLKDHEAVFAEVGFNNYIAAGCKAHYEVFKETAQRYPYTLAGYFGEAVRLRDWAEKKGKYFSLSDYVENYYMNKALKGVYSHYEQLKTFIEAEHKKQLMSLGYQGDVENIPIDFFERFRWIMARFCDTRSVFMNNIYCFSFPLMGIPYIHEAVLSLPSNIIRDSRFQIKLLLSLDEDVINKFDLFSHNRPWRIINGHKVRKISKANIADLVSEKLPFIRPLLRRVYRNLRNNEGHQRNTMLNDIEPFRKLIPSYVNIDLYKESLIRLRAALVGVNALNKCEL